MPFVCQVAGGTKPKGSWRVLLTFMQSTLILTLCLTTYSLGAAGIDLEALATNSPFGTGAKASTTQVAPAANLELRGMYQENGRTFYSVYNTTTKQGIWVAADEKSTEATAVVVKSFDPATSTLVIESAGRASSLTLKPATVSKYEAPAPPTVRVDEGGGRGGPPLPEPGPDGKVQTPWGNFTPEQIAAYRAERERRWQERMQQVQAEGGEAGASRRSRSDENANEGAATEGSSRRRGSR